MSKNTWDAIEKIAHQLYDDIEPPQEEQNTWDAFDKIAHEFYDDIEPPKKKHAGGRPRKQNVERYTEGKSAGLIKHDRRAGKKQVICVDTEGEDRVGPNGTRHALSLLAGSDGKGFRVHISSPKMGYKIRRGNKKQLPNYGLTTTDCLELLLNLPQNSIVFGFAFTYDTYKILQDIDLKNWEELRKEKETVWTGDTGVEYHIEYIPRKQFTIKSGKKWKKQKKRDGSTKRIPYWTRSTVVWDVFGFFQTSFVNTLKAWEIGSPEIWDRIKGMKDQRSDFSYVEDQKIIEYCYEECDLLSDLMRRFLEITEGKEVNLRLSRYDGAGALAGAWMEKNKIKKYISETNLDEKIALAAYYGGRFEISRTGYIGDGYIYDINSAYPYFIAKLPCLMHGKFRQVQELEPGKIGVYKVSSYTGGCTEKEFLCEGKSLREWAPFPWRRKDGVVYYAHHKQSVETYCWIWSYEVEVARKYFGDDIVIHEGWVWDGECDHQPFADIPKLYAYRKELKKEKNPAEKIIKLIINSIYGKTAQSVGYKDGKKPAFQSFIWAGLITSGCRSMVMDAIFGSNTVVSSATDGIISTEPIDWLPLSDKLGDWEYKKVEDLYLMQSGIYFGTIVESDDPREIGTELYKTRGFPKDKVPSQLWRDAWWNMKTRSTYWTSPEFGQFIGAMSALMRKEPLKWIGEWDNSVTRDFKFTPPRRYFMSDFGDEYMTDDEGYPIVPEGDYWLTQPVLTSGASAPYKKKQSRSELDDEVMNGNRIQEKEQPLGE